MILNYNLQELSMCPIHIILIGCDERDWGGITKVWYMKGKHFNLLKAIFTTG